MHHDGDAICEVAQLQQRVPRQEPAIVAERIAIAANPLVDAADALVDSPHAGSATSS